MSKAAKRGERPSVRKELLLTETLSEMLEEAASETGIPGNELIRRALSEYLPQEGKPGKVPVIGFLRKGDPVRFTSFASPYPLQPPSILEPGTYALMVTDESLQDYAPIEAAPGAHLFFRPLDPPPPGATVHVQITHENGTREDCLKRYLGRFNGDSLFAGEGQPLRVPADRHTIRGVYITKFEVESGNEFPES